MSLLGRIFRKYTVPIFFIIWSLKVPDLSQFGANLTQFKDKFSLTAVRVCNQAHRGVLNSRSQPFNSSLYSLQTQLMYTALTEGRKTNISTYNEAKWDNYRFFNIIWFHLDMLYDECISSSTFWVANRQTRMYLPTGRPI